MRDLLLQYQESLALNIRVAIFIALALIACFIVLYLISLIIRGIGTGITIIKMDLLLHRIQHAKVVDDRVRLIEEYNNRVQNMSEKKPSRQLKLIKFIRLVLILAAIALCVLIFVNPSMEISQKTLEIYRSIESSLMRI